MRIVGIVLLVLGIIGCIFFGIQAAGDSESFSLFGAEIAVSSANWTPLIVSAIVLVVGIFMSRSGK